ncbi:hypothetical protein KW846_03440 [Pseudomonas sp. PDM32]|uniref:hypothetical protein n=1 Tax=Pseudomonas sp. PDM32 TaxID=2854768 RepID=UPI001C4973F2|nr:hypothetical protein [Pseudomonas sp. PDM32]MBV7571746.1 hypothetical protein [Pseudomonas sp. PDM32]
MKLSTSDSWGKIERARFHLSELYRQVHGFIDGELLQIPVYKVTLPEQGYISLRIQEIPPISAGFRLILGDVIHNYRSSLDYLWWQLACRNLGREPTSKEAGGVQFPLLSVEGDWGVHRSFKHVALPDVEFLKRFQPFNAAADQTMVLEALREMSNHDKHRTLNPTLTKINDYTVKNIGDADKAIYVEVKDLPEKLRVDSEIAKVFKEFEGEFYSTAEVYVEFRACLTVHDKWNVFSVLEEIDHQCELMLNEAKRIL